MGPALDDFAVAAVEAGGGTVVPTLPEAGGPAEPPADGLVWLSAADVAGLTRALEAHPGVRWVQLPFAGVEAAVAAGVVDSSRAWTCAKGSYGRPVAEHALLLALAGLRVLPSRITARTWGKPEGRSLYGAPVTIVGGGGITRELLDLLEPFGVSATVVRRQAGQSVRGAARTVGQDELDSVLPGSLVVFLALALTPETEGIIGAEQMRAIGPDGWLVNVARGGHVVTDDLVACLADGSLGGAALDVTDPEPLPDGHPLWTSPNCIITPHTADTWEMVKPLLAARIQENVAAFVAGSPLVGVVDPVAGY
jgi:phosphoglycerate dehydrogenase-like enzyme